MSAPYFDDGAVTIWHGNALALPIPDESVDLIVTSPPYFGLRSYTDGGEHYEGQIGSEPTPREFVDALIAATAEMVRVLKPSGSIWVNLGDKYSGAQAQNFGGASRAGDSAKVWAQTNPKNTGIPNKSLMGVPWRYALRCIGGSRSALDDVDVVRLLLRDVALGCLPLTEAEAIVSELASIVDPGLGLILRAEVIWSKPNGLPESVTDRVRRSHEQWFHFTKEPRYFSAVDEIREEHAATTVARAQPHRAPVTGTRDAYQGMPGQTILRDQSMNPLGKLPGSVWEIPTQPLTVPAHLGVDHFAAFPMEWPRRIIQGWSPSGICVECAHPRRPITSRTPMQWRPSPTIDGRQAPGTARTTMSGTMLAPASTLITGYACACATSDAPIRPAVVLDPFGGTGTTALVAKALGRTGWHVDLSADYCRLAQWRVNDPGELARAMQVEKPPAEPEGMDSLLDLLGEAS